METVCSLKWDELCLTPFEECGKCRCHQAESCLLMWPEWQKCDSTTRAKVLNIIVFTEKNEWKKTEYYLFLRCCVSLPPHRLLPKPGPALLASGIHHGGREDRGMLETFKQAAAQETQEGSTISLSDKGIKLEDIATKSEKTNRK